MMQMEREQFVCSFKIETLNGDSLLHCSFDPTFEISDFYRNFRVLLNWGGGLWRSPQNHVGLGFNPINECLIFDQDVSAKFTMFEECFLVYIVLENHSQKDDFDLSVPQRNSFSGITFEPLAL